ncbi:hypothetical protein ACFE04_022154 [Oxalis oulophora]
MMHAEKKTRGRQKIEIKRIENENDRYCTFSKRKAGILKKANEIATLCGAEVGILVFSPTGKPFSYGNPSFEKIKNKYFKMNPPCDDNNNPYVEAYRRHKIEEMSRQLNDLEVKLDEEKKKEKYLIKLRESNQGQNWWDVPIENIEMAEVENMEVLIKNFHQKLVVRGDELASVASSSGGPNQGFVPINYGVAQAQASMDIGMVNTNISQQENMALNPYENNINPME